jgi:hypothetical protein
LRTHDDTGLAGHIRKPVPAELVARLRAPLPPEAITKHGSKDYLSSIKPIYVVERLNDVFGLGGWCVGNEIIEPGAKMIVVRSRLTVPEYGIEVEAFGGHDNADRGDAYKGACSDALTKIGAYLYIAMDVYKGLGDKKESKATASRQQNRPPSPTSQVSTPPVPPATGEWPVNIGLKLTEDQILAYTGPKLPTEDGQEEVLTIKVTGCVEGNTHVQRLVNFHTYYDNLEHRAACFKPRIFPVLDNQVGVPNVTIRIRRVKAKGKSYLNIEDIEGLPQPVTQATEITDADYVPF